jgi:toxin HigB-1
MSIRSFGNRGTSDIAGQRATKAARQVLPSKLHAGALEKLILLDAARSLADLAVWPSLRLEKLKGQRSGQRSIRINERYRICFMWHDGDAFAAEIVDYH